MIQLKTLGTLDLRGPDGHEIRSVLAQPKRLALLTYLAVQMPRGFQRRDQVLALFWPDHDDVQARRALNRALHYLRSSLGDGVLLSRGDDEIGLAREAFGCDAADFELAAAEGRHRDAVSLYGGDLLDGFHSDSPEFSHWLDGKRDALKQVAARSAWSVVEEERARGTQLLAAQWARWAVARAPYDEASVRRLIQLLDASGDRAGAVREYEEFRRRIAEDLELTPAPETVALVEAIRSRRDPTSDAGALPLPGAVTDEAPFPAALEGSNVATQIEPARPDPRAREKRAALVRLPRNGRAAEVVAACALVGVIAFTLGLPVLRSREPQAVAPEAPDSTLVLVQSISNRTGDPAFDGIAREATDWIARSVADVVESAGEMGQRRIAHVVRDGAADGAPSSGAETRAGTVISGELFQVGGSLRFHVRILDALRGERAWPIQPISTASRTVDDAIGELGERATGGVVALRQPTIAEWFPLATAPPTYQAMKEYLRARATVRSWEAGEVYESAGRTDPTFVWALVEAAWMGRMRDRAHAHAIVLELDEKRDQMNPLQAAALGVLITTEAGDRQGTYSALGTAASIAPSRFLLEFATAAYGLNRPREALRLIDRFEQMYPAPGPVANWSFRTELLHQMGRHVDELAAARRVRERMPRAQGPIWAEARALAALGDVASVDALVDTVLSLPAEPFFTPGTLMLTAAQELRAHGHPDPAAELGRRAVEWYRSTEPTPTPSLPVHDRYLAYALYDAGDWTGAESVFRRLADTDPSARAEYYGMLGAIAARSAHRSEAEAYLTAVSALDIPEEGQSDDVGLARARIAALLGDGSRALSFLRQGYQGGQGVDLHTDVDFAPLIASDPAFQEFVRPKG